MVWRERLDVNPFHVVWCSDLTSFPLPSAVLWVELVGYCLTWSLGFRIPWRA
jgi:hypothetical protein